MLDSFDVALDPPGTSGEEAQAALNFAADLLQLANQTAALATSPSPGQRQLAHQLAVVMGPPVSMAGTIVLALLEVILNLEPPSEFPPDPLMTPS